jgi:hypothetical protein
MSYPSASEVLRTRFVTGVLGEPGRWRAGQVLAGLLLFVLLALAFPRFDHIPDNAGLIISFLAVIAYGGVFEASEERKRGHPRVVQVAAFLGSVAATAVGAVILLALSIALGPEPGKSPVDAFARSFALPAGVPGLVLVGAAMIGLVLLRYWLLKRPRRRA